MNTLIALFLILIAGVINGSFALPTKHVEKWRFENIWFQFAVWSFFLFPWVAAWIWSPQIGQVYAQAPWSLLIVMIIGGVAFGIGQICFATAMGIIGIGLDFVVNLGIGTGFGFLLPLVVQHPHEILRPFGLVTLTGTVLAILGLVYSTYAGKLRDEGKAKVQETTSQMSQTQQTGLTGKYVLGVFLALIAGFTSAGQNFSFSYTSHMQQIALGLGASHLGAATIMWPGFLTSAFIPYAIYMLALGVKNKSFGNYARRGVGHYYLFAVGMGVFWYGSLIFYSKASQLIGALGPVVGWPMFMVLIILAANFWGWRYGEWTGCSSKAKHTLWIGLGLLCLAIVVLGYSSVVHT